jgi:DNA-binding response OmpR family regulator
MAERFATNPFFLSLAKTTAKAGFQAHVLSSGYLNGQESMSVDKKEKILILEDEEFHRSVLGDGLEDYYQYEIERAEDIESAEEILRRFQPDLFLLDIVLQGDKFQVIQWVKNLRSSGRYRDVPVLFVTAQDEMQQHVKDMERTGFLSKPFTFEDVIGRIQELLKSADK